MRKLADSCELIAVIKLRKSWLNRSVILFINPQTFSQDFFVSNLSGITRFFVRSLCHGIAQCCAHILCYFNRLNSLLITILHSPNNNYSNRRIN